MAYSNLPSLNELGQLFDFDFHNGQFFWKKGRRSNKEAGTTNSNGYNYVTINGNKYYCHRIIYYFFYKEDISLLMIDHIDGNKINNKIINLRKVTSKENQIARSKQKTGRLITQQKYLINMKKKWGL